MFCVLLGENQKGLKLPFFKKTAVETVTYGGSHYDIIRTRIKKGKFNMKAVAKAARGRPIVAEVYIKQNSEVVPHLFDSSRFAKQVEISTVMEILSLASIFKRSISIAFFDKDCRYAGCLGKLMELSNEVYIITSEIEQYSEYAADCYPLFGAAPIVTDANETASRCNVIFSPDAKGSFDTSRCVFAPKKEGYHLEKECIPTVSGCPENVDRLDFAGALYELCEIKRLGNLTAGFMVKNGVKESLKSIADRICLDIG